MRILFLFAVEFFIFMLGVGFCLNVPIHIEETSEIDRLLEPVRVGVPLPVGKFFVDKKTGQTPFKITDKAGKTVPAQFRVLSFYHDKSIRWVLADFQATVNSKQKAVYRMQDGGNGNTREEGIKIEESDGDIRVDTGAVSFSVTSGGFNIFDEVSIPAQGDYHEKELISSSDDAGLILADLSREEYFSSLGEVSEVKIEERGPMRVTILFRGSLAAQDREVFQENKARYTCRITAYRGKAFVRVALTLENLGKYGFRHEDNQSESYSFREFSLNLPLNMRPDKDITTEEYSGSYKNMQKFSLFQYHQLKDVKNETKNFGYIIKKESQEEITGFRDKGWVDVNDGNFGVTAFVEKYWQNFPKETSFVANNLSIGLWPWGGRWPPTLAEELKDKSRGLTQTRAGEIKLESEEAIDEEEEVPLLVDSEKNTLRDKRASYRFRGGLRKTYTTFFRFYHGGLNKDKAKEFAGALAMPLIPHCEPAWYADSGALGFFTEKGWKTDNVLLKEAFKRYEKLQSCKVNIEDSEYQRGKEIPPSTIYTEREKRGEHEEWYGWMDFGDLAWGGNKWEGGYCSLHYDWTYGMLMQFLRTGDTAFFRLGDEMARHRMDIDQYYSPAGSPWLSGFQWNEFGKHDRIDDDPWEPLPSHTWIQGLIYYYMITGSQESLEAALQTGEATKYYWTHTFDDNTEPGDEEIRIQGWSIENLVTLYDLTGEEKYITLAHNIFKYRMAPFIRRGGYTGASNYVNVFWLLLASEPMAKLYECVKDPVLLSTILRVVNFLVFEAYQGGVFDGDKLYKQLYLPYHYNRKTKIPYDPYPPYNFLASNIIAYAYLKTGNPAFLNFSRRVFRDAVNYWQEGAEYSFPNKLSSISYAAVHFPGSKTKVHGFTNRYPLMYLYMEKHLRLDSVLPSMINDIELSSYKTGRVSIDWTSPQDDSRKEAVSEYFIRYAGSPILSEVDWLSAKLVPNTLKPAKPGDMENFSIDNLVPGKEYYIAIKSIDDANNYSIVSNSPSIRPHGIVHRFSKRDGIGHFLDSQKIYDGTVTFGGGDVTIKTLGKILGVGKKDGKERKTLLYFKLMKGELNKIRRATIRLFCKSRSLPPPNIVARSVPPNFFPASDRSENLLPINRAVSKKVKKGSIKGLFKSLVSLSGLSKGFPKSFEKKSGKKHKQNTHKNDKRLGKVVDTVVPWVRKRWYEWDVTPILNKWEEDGQKKYFMLESTGSEGWAVFVSNENNNNMRRPVLTVIMDEGGVKK